MPLADSAPSLQQILSRASGGLTPDEPQALLASIAALVFNVAPDGGPFHRGRIPELVLRIDRMVSAQLDAILHAPEFQAVESAWRSVAYLVERVNFRASIQVELLDASKEEIAEDFDANAGDLVGSALFRKVYLAEFDVYGGRPFGLIAGLFEFDATARDVFWLRQMGKIGALAHAPFVGAAAPAMFGCTTAEELGSVRDPEGFLRQPRFGAWQALREAPESSYLGLVLPRFLLRSPWHPETAPAGSLLYEEDVARIDGSAYLVGNPAVLFALNVAASFESTGWCQHLRGPHGGGLVSGLPRHDFRLRDERILKAPIEVGIPDRLETAFASAGFIPLIARPMTTEACFFSCQSLRAVPKMRDGGGDAPLVANLSYTFSVARIAHYVKCITRDNVGVALEASHVERHVQAWIESYVTTVVGPDDLTLSYYPFKGAKVSVRKTDGVVGKFQCSLTVSPHLQFEGVDVDLKLDTRLA
jgi:type VI secretion system protein ImpC